MAIFLQYYQMKQMNSRNPQAAAANPQMQQMQKFFPIIFGLIYLRVPAGATIYMVVSSAMRIGTQEIMFRTGMVTPVAPAEREIGGGAAPPKGGGTAQKAIGTGTGKTGTGSGAGKPAGGTAKAGGGTAKAAAGTAKAPGKSAAAAKRPNAGNGANGANGSTPAGKTGANGRAQPNGRRPTNGRSSPAAKASNGNNTSNDAEIEPVVVPKEHPRSRSKRTRKAR